MDEEEEGKYVARLSHEIGASGRESSIASGKCSFQFHTGCSLQGNWNLNIGCFAHYAKLRQHDANFSRYEKANEWLVTFDVLSMDMYLNGDFALSQYLPYTLVPFYPLFQERGGQRVERSQADWEVDPQLLRDSLSTDNCC
jgi:chromosome transmission fidelity protein 18